MFSYAFYDYVSGLPQLVWGFPQIASSHYSHYGLSALLFLVCVPTTCVKVSHSLREVISHYSLQRWFCLSV